MIGSHTFGSNAIRDQTLSMNKLSVSPIVYAELPSEARVLLFILGMGATVRFGVQPPKRSDLDPLLEIVWNRNRLCLSDLADPFLMTKLLKTKLSSVCLAGSAQ
jgi:hypothetical protein